MKKLALVLALAFAFAPAAAQQPAYGPPTTQFSYTFGASTVAKVKIIPGITGKSIYITALVTHPAATSVVTLSYGSGTNCGTGNVDFYGPATFQAGENANAGSGAGAIYVVPSGKDVCLTIATAAAPGWISYAQY